MVVGKAFAVAASVVDAALEPVVPDEGVPGCDPFSPGCTESGAVAGAPVDDSDVWAFGFEVTM